jgi:predicted lipid-binding transport protein (Tim44 family)
MQFIEIVIFAGIAAFLVFRLRSVLGRRTGHERPPFDPYSRGQAPAERPEAAEPADDDTVISLPNRSQPREEPVDPNDPVAVGLAKIRAADSGFDKDTFIQGARAAFDMIVASFAAGDRETLRPLLSDEVYENFAGAIIDRADKGHTMETTLVGIRSADIVEANLDGRIAFVTVKFVTEQIEVERDAAGEVVSGNPSRVATVTDIWTFARNTRSRNPNWTLVATEASN